MANPDSQLVEFWRIFARHIASKESIAMSSELPEENEYLDLPSDPEMGFAVLQRKKYKALELTWESSQSGGWYHERRYVDTLIAYDEVHELGVLTAYRSPPSSDANFSSFFQDFRRAAEIASQKIMMEAARRTKVAAQDLIVLDATAREAIHVLINGIREKLNQLSLPENKRESLFNKLNAFAAEVDRNRTRTESFYAFAIETARVAREVNDEIKPLQQTIDRIFDWLDKAKKLVETLPPWQERKRISGPTNKLPPPDTKQDDEIPF